MLSQSVTYSHVVCVCPCVLWGDNFLAGGISPTQLEWSMKLWWVHCEALIAALMAYATTHDPTHWDMFKQMLDYSAARVSCYQEVLHFPTIGNQWDVVWSSICQLLWMRNVWLCTFCVAVVSWQWRRRVVWLSHKRGKSKSVLQGRTIQRCCRAWSCSYAPILYALLSAKVHIVSVVTKTWDGGMEWNRTPCNFPVINKKVSI